MAKVVIVGGGFGGLNAAKSLKRTDHELLVIDRTNHHLFQPLLYQVAGALLSPGDIAAPIREILQRQKNAEVIMAEVVAIDKEKQQVTIKEGKTYPFDYLILAPGARHSYFGHPEWEKHAPGIKTLNDAIAIRERLLFAFEQAELVDDPQVKKKWLRFVIIGGGPTGVELAGMTAEIAHKTLFHNFHKIHPEMAEIYLIEGAPHLIPSFCPEQSEIARKELEEMGVNVKTGVHVTKITDDAVYVGDEKLETTNVVWAAGNHASPLLKTLNVPLDRAGRVSVKSDLSIERYENIFVIGDAASFETSPGKTLPGIAPVAMQQGRHVAKIIKTGERSLFKYYDKGTIATIGKAKAVADIWGYKFSGLFAYFIWSFVHIAYLISFRNRFFVMSEWFMWYISGERHVRLIKR